MTSCSDASRHAPSSQIDMPAMFTPMSVGDLYGEDPRILSKSLLSTGKISTSRL
jgi:hypothetical protein